MSSSDAPKTCGTCGNGTCAAARRKQGESDEDFKDRQKLQARLCCIQHTVVVLSGKGGVGKSTVAVNLAAALAAAGKRVGLLDIDIHGPSIPTMLGLEGRMVAGPDGEMRPVEIDGIKVVSIGFFLENQDNAVIWRGPMKTTVIKQFLQDVAWGELDYLIIDSPPGTGDEPLSVCQLAQPDGAVIVTTPQKVATVDVRKSITFCRLIGVPVLGIVENMGGFACPKCGEVTPILGSGGGQAIARDMGIPFLGSIPIDPAVAETGDAGRAFMRHHQSTATAVIMRGIIDPLIATCERQAPVASGTIK
ncbi:MAG: Mrp/NBP35 family ATP-binding protein [Candidatus Edwardsbacteria bacterium]|jgi:Mrp family chromosome partitioning ATPase|nr:Mrp/NBP35 family ATP-binding protein [Candidatus Edwardsbacteria bacterium]